MHCVSIQRIAKDQAFAILLGGSPDVGDAGFLAAFGFDCSKRSTSYATACERQRDMKADSICTFSKAKAAYSLLILSSSALSRP